MKNLGCGCLLLVVIALGAGYWWFTSSTSGFPALPGRGAATAVPPAAGGASASGPVAVATAPALIPPPEGFASDPSYVVPPDTEVPGVGVVDQGFAFTSLHNVEFITGYTFKIPTDVDLSGFQLEIKNPARVLEILLLGLKSVGVNDRANLDGFEPVGDEAVGLTLTTTWNETKLRANVVVFRRNNVGALAAVIFIDGKGSSVSVMDVAREMDNALKAK